MSSTSFLAGGTTKTTATATNTTRSLFTLALRAWNLCVRLVVTAALLLVSPAAVVILLPVACMAVSACILCAIAARILLPFFVPPPDGAREPPSGVVREQKQDCIEVDRAEAPGGFDDDASSAEEGHRAEGPEQEHGLGSSSFDEGFSDPGDDDEQRRVFFVDTGSYYRTFYDLLAFWRSMEREATGGARNARYIK
ncbi:hypothetical protein SETIT_2G242000v2 [Setaria italica]|uniref:Uncharacterized protein n=1 Tax=Setaria italica TaxID=4555 RepID=A0A368Q234_SETIT|nr:hypothetical protein SETIT_2G242000v2 [Setaria italica]